MVGGFSLVCSMRDGLGWYLRDPVFFFFEKDYREVGGGRVHSVDFSETRAVLDRDVPTST